MVLIVIDDNDDGGDDDGFGDDYGIDDVGRLKKMLMMLRQCCSII